MDKRIILEAANMIALVYTAPSMQNYFSGFGVETKIIEESAVFAKKRFAETVMNTLAKSGKESDQRIIFNIVEDLTCYPDTSKYNYAQNTVVYENKLAKLRQLLEDNGYRCENRKLVKGTTYLPDIDKKYEFIIVNLKDYGRDDLATSFKDAIKNYAQGSPLSLHGLRHTIENLHKHILDRNGEKNVNARENIRKLKNLGILKMPSSDPRYQDVEVDFSYNIYQMLSNWTVHGAKTPEVEHNFLFQTSILYLDFLIRRINASGVKTK